MTEKKVLEYIEKYPGYLKKSPKKLASALGIPTHYADFCLRKYRSLKSGRTIQLQPAPESMGLMEARTFVAQELIKQNKIDEAIDVLRAIKKEDALPTYEPSTFTPGVYAIIGCTHFPFHDKKLWKAFCDYVAQEKDLEGVILAGDILDMHSISRHAKGLITLPGYDLGREYAEANKALDMLDKAIGDRKIRKEYFYGNHEDWYNANQKEVDSQKMGTAGITNPYDACFKERGYKTQFNWKTAEVKLGDLLIIHGEWLNMHAAHKHVHELRENVLFFHTHRMQIFHEGDITGYNAGGGFDRNHAVFNYASRPMKKRWKNGFATARLMETGKTLVQVHPWDGLFHINGTIYNGNT